MTELTSVAKKIMSVFHYYQIRQSDVLSLKQMLTRKYLWLDIEEEEFQDALSELIRKNYIVGVEEPKGWMLLEQGAKYLKGLKR
jgi:hypothetical protein